MKGGLVYDLRAPLKKGQANWPPPGPPINSAPDPHT